LRYLRLAAGLLLLLRSLPATVISGSIVNLAGQGTSNRSVQFTLQNCGANLPIVTGSAIVVPATYTMVPNAAGILAGTLAGNDIISCGTVIGQTYYKVTVFAGKQQIYQGNYLILGPVWNIAMAVAISNDPTAFLNYQNGNAIQYQVGDLIYGAGLNQLGLLHGMISSTPMLLCTQGNGAVPGPPYWCSLNSSMVPTPSNLPALSGDVSNSTTSTLLTVTQVGGMTAAAVATAVQQVQNATASNVVGTLVKRDSSGNVSAGVLTANAIQFVGTSQGACTSANRGWLQYTAAGAGVKDAVAVCAKDAANAYAWRTIY